jgi:hypothetical protein
MFTAGLYKIVGGHESQKITFFATLEELRDYIKTQKPGIYDLRRVLDDASSVQYSELWWHVSKSEDGQVFAVPGSSLRD